MEVARPVARSSTPNHLLDVAERLLAERGLDGVSLRRINTEAGLNPAAIHYHFGSKSALIGHATVATRGRSSRVPF